MKRFTTDEFKWQCEVGTLEEELSDLLKDEQQEKAEGWQRKIDTLKTKYAELIKEVTISSSSRRPELEEKFKIHPGCTYKVELEDKSPRDMERPQYIGLLKEITIRIDDTDFAITNVVLQDVIKHGKVCTIGKSIDHYAIPFDEIKLSRKDKIRSFSLIEK